MTHKAERPRTHKIRNAAVAGTLGIALLAAGGGTFANWYESAEINGGTITAGNLALNTPAGVVWAVNGTTIPTEDLAAFRMVPGDVVTYTATFTPTLVGDNLEATITADSTNVIPAEAVGHVTVSTSLTDAFDATVEALTDAHHNDPISVAVTIDMPFAAGTDTNPTQGAALDLKSLTLDLVQTDHTTP